MTHTRTHKITLPIVEPELIQNTVHFTQAYRDDGFRFQLELLNNKTLIHNYGQGGAEGSLAYGCAYMSIKMLSVKCDITKVRSAAVLGNTINSLFTALELLKRGIKVTLYSDTKERTSGSQGLQFWYPGLYDNCDPLKHELISKLSFQFLRECLENSRYQSLEWANCYAMGPKADEIRDVITEFVIEKIDPVLLDFGNQQLEEYCCYRTILMDTNFLMRQIFTEIQLRNASIQNKTFDNLQDVLNIPEQIIFNCLGAESKHLFNDPKLKIINRSHIEMKGMQEVPTVEGVEGAKDSSSQILWKSFEGEGEQDMVICCTQNSIQIGSSWEEEGSGGSGGSGSSLAVKDQIFNKAYHFVRERKTKPMKL